MHIPYRTDDPKAEFIALVSARLKSLAGPPDVLNRCRQAPCYSAGASESQQRIYRGQPAGSSSRPPPTPA